MVENKYRRKALSLCGKQVFIDYYVIADAFDMSSRVGHSVKKCLAAGSRGSKQYRQDITEARNQLNMELEKLDRIDALNNPQLTIDFGEDDDEVLP